MRVYQEWVAASRQLYRCPWNRLLEEHKGSEAELYCMLILTLNSTLPKYFIIIIIIIES